MFKVSLPVGLVVVVCVLLHANLSEAENGIGEAVRDEQGNLQVRGPKVKQPSWAVDTRTSGGSVFKFPYFAVTFNTMDPELRRSLNTDIKDTLGYLREVMHYWLTNPGFSYRYNYVTVGSKMIIMAISQHANRKKLDKTAKAFKRDFNKKMSAFFDGLLEASKKDLKTTPKLDADELDRQLTGFIDSFLEAVEQSPVSIYLNFSEGQVDDQPFPAMALALMKQLRMHGYEKPLNLFGRMIHKKVDLSNS